ncbi:hypothetical protein KAT92_05605, partial [Candidatus Babeliales bacterium]|nr:hypothetical protein [Candidatus Babeliales bacterium]
MVASKSYNNPDTDFLKNAFFLSAPVQLSSPPNITPKSAGWGAERNFSVIVSHYTDVNLTLWHSKGASGGPYSIANNTIVSSPSGTQVDVFQNYTCTDISTWFFKFNATDVNDGGDSSTGFVDYTLTEDDILIGQDEVGNASYVNRSDTLVPIATLLAHSVNDTERNMLAASPQATLYLNATTDNDDAFTTFASNQTNSTGYANFYFLPDCSYSVGEQKWRTYTSGDTCYSNALSENFTVYLQGDLRPNVTKPVNLFEYQNGAENVTINITVPDECNASITGVSFNITLNNTDESTIDYCTNIIELGNGNYSCEWNTTTTGVGRYDVIVLAYGVGYYNNGTTIRVDSFRVIPPINNPANLTNSSVLQNPWGWGGVFNFSVEVYDQDYDNVNVSFWISPDNVSWTYHDSQNCTACNGWNELNFSYEGFSCIDQQLWYFKFNATDGVNATVIPEGNFTVQKDNVTISYSAGGGNATYVNRSTPGTTHLILQVFDAINVTNPYLPAGRNGTFWVTYNDSYYNNGYFNQTNTSGHLNYVFKPSCSPKYFVGPQNWTGGIIETDTCYYAANYTPPLTVYVVGDMNDTLVSPAGEDFFEGQNVSIRINITEECSVLDTLNDSLVYFNISHDAYSDTCTLINETTGYYNCTWNVTGAPGGWYNITADLDRIYFNSKSTAYAN